MKLWKTLALVLLGSLLAAVAVVAVYRDEVGAFALTVLADHEQQSASAFIGHRPPDRLVLARRDGGAQIPAPELISGEAIIMVYSHGCSACRNALNHFLAVRQGRPDYGRALYLLAREADFAPPAGFPPAQVLESVSRADSDMFAGIITPRMYRFGPEGRLVEVMIGYERARFGEWLEALHGP